MGPSSVAFPVDPPDGSVTGSSWQAFRRPLTDGAAPLYRSAKKYASIRM
jgi:hypothetical protein